MVLQKKKGEEKVKKSKRDEVEKGNGMVGRGDEGGGNRHHVS